eukprot:15365213-Ditylum_brightwellii.AAC.2
MAILFGKIQDICSMTPWGKHICIDIHHSVPVYLPGNFIALKATSKRFQKLEECIKANKINIDDELKAHFAQSHAAKEIWAYNK